MLSTVTTIIGAYSGIYKYSTNSGDQYLREAHQALGQSTS